MNWPGHFPVPNDAASREKFHRPAAVTIRPVVKYCLKPLKASLGRAFEDFCPAILKTLLGERFKDFSTKFTTSLMG